MAERQDAWVAQQRLPLAMANCARSPHLHALVQDWLKGRGINPDEQADLYAAGVADQDAYAAAVAAQRDNAHEAVARIADQRDALADALRGMQPIWCEDHCPQWRGEDRVHGKECDVARAALAKMENREGLPLASDAAMAVPHRDVPVQADSRTMGQTAATLDPDEGDTR